MNALKHTDRVRTDAREPTASEPSARYETKAYKHQGTNSPRVRTRGYKHLGEALGEPRWANHTLGEPPLGEPYLGEQ